jgi:thymidine phosphorylase
VAYLTGGGVREPRLHEITMALAGEMLALGGLASTAAAGQIRAEAVLANGQAAEVFARMVAALGGPVDFVDRPGVYLSPAPVIKPCTAQHSGHVVGMNARAVGMAVVALGGGRSHADDAIDPAVGLSEMTDVGVPIRAGGPLCIVHAASEADAEAAIALVRNAVRIGDVPPVGQPAIMERVVP